MDEEKTEKTELDEKLAAALDNHRPDIALHGLCRVAAAIIVNRSLEGGAHRVTNTFIANLIQLVDDNEPI